MAIRLSGLSSGLDTESIVKELMSAQSMRLTKVQNKKTKLEWKEEKWKELNKKIYDLYTGDLSKLKLQSSYFTKNVSISDSTKATITAGSGVPSGTHTVEINRVASSQFVTGTEITTIGPTSIKGSDITSGTKLSALGIAAGTQFAIKTQAGESATYTVTDSSKISDLTSFAKQVGVNLSYDTTNQRFFASAMESGEKNAFSLTASSPKATAERVQNDILECVGYKHLTQDQQKSINDAIGDLGTKEKDSDEYKKAATLLQKYADAYKTTVDSKVETEKFQETLQKKIDVNLKNDSFHVVNSTLENDMAALKGVLGATDETSPLTAMGLGEITFTGIAPGTSKASFIEAKNAEIKYNGTVFNSSSNTIKINGLTINAIEVTTTPMKVNVTNNTDGVYDMVKGFVSSYNSVLKEVNELYYAGTAKGYDVLSDEEREVMTEEQIEKWETKIKDSLLRSDTTLGVVKSALTSLQSATVTVNGKNYSLADFGVRTTDYTEKGLLHIDGNSEDAASSANKDKLKAAIDSDPDLVMQVFTELGNQLYKTLGDKMSSTSLSSALTFYNDKQISSQKTSYENEIKKWQAKLSDIEDRYYAKFTAMETALSKLNNQTSYISSLFSS